MKKKWLAGLSFMMLLFGVYTVSMADEDVSSSTAAKLNSNGGIEYRDGQNYVVVDSDDLYMLADQIDSFKMTVANQLIAMRTYLTTGDVGMAVAEDGSIRVVHSKPSSQIDPLTLDFDIIMKGLAASQSIPLSLSEYELENYHEGMKLYRTEDGKLVVDASVQGAQEVSPDAAISDHLSAGKAAWVDGKLLLGTGADNQAYYRLGYTKGYAASQPANGTIKYHYHIHVNGSGEAMSNDQIIGNDPGGCYKAEKHIHTDSCPQGTCTVEAECYSSSKGQSGKYHNFYTYTHRNCGEGVEDGSSWDNNKREGDRWTSTHLYYTCGNQPVNVWTIQCGKTPSTIEWAEIIYN